MQKRIVNGVDEGVKAMQRGIDFDLIGIGFGPSNLALGVRLAEAGGAVAAKHCFIEQQPTFGWHKGMLLESCRMQISFLKDLVTMRDPTSRFSFINYLFERGRLPEFINVKSFYPTRQEFHDYLAWAASKIESHVQYGETVSTVLPVFSKDLPQQVMALEVVSHDAAGRTLRRVARALSIGLGGIKHIPSPFNDIDSPRMVHSSQYLTCIDRLIIESASPSKRVRVAVIGSGQSAAEVFVDLTRRYAHVDASLIMRSPALKPADDSAFVNEIFDPNFTDVMYQQSPEKRKWLTSRFRDTNYAVVDKALIDVIYNILYQQKVAAYSPHRVMTNAHVEAVTIDREEQTVQPDRQDRQNQSHRITLKILDSLHGHRYAECFDVVVLATGYSRDAHLKLLQPLSSVLGDNLADAVVRRDYCLPTPKDFLPRIYLQGACEESHGLSDTLLSVLAIRADDIAASLEEMWSLPRCDEEMTEVLFVARSQRPLPIINRNALNVANQVP